MIELKLAEILMTDKLITPMIAKVLGSMKVQEIASFLIKPEVV
jgi:hypothetical protein